MSTSVPPSWLLLSLLSSSASSLSRLFVVSVQTGSKMSFPTPPSASSHRSFPSTAFSDPSQTIPAAEFPPDSPHTHSASQGMPSPPEGLRRMRETVLDSQQGQSASLPPFFPSELAHLLLFIENSLRRRSPSSHSNPSPPSSLLSTSPVSTATSTPPSFPPSPPRFDLSSSDPPARTRWRRSGGAASAVSEPSWERGSFEGLCSEGDAGR
jgi:hypothetical protein